MLPGLFLLLNVNNSFYFTSLSKQLTEVLGISLNSKSVLFFEILDYIHFSFSQMIAEKSFSYFKEQVKLFSQITYIIFRKSFIFVAVSTSFI